jgi:hypothetical protein
MQVGKIALTESFFLFLHFYLFSACDPVTTCTGKEKECNGGVCKCKNGYKEDPEIKNPDGKDACVLEDAGRKNCIVSDRFFLFKHLSLFSACNPAITCTGKEKECNGGVCKCKNGYKEDPEIENPDGKDDCVEAGTNLHNKFFIFESPRPPFDSSANF